MFSPEIALQGARIINTGGPTPELSFRRFEAIQGSSLDHLSALSTDVKGKGKARDEGPRLRRLTDPFLLALEGVREISKGKGEGAVERAVVFGHVQVGKGRSSLWVFEIKQSGHKGTLQGFEFQGLTEVDASRSPTHLHQLVACTPHRRLTCNSCTHPLLINNDEIIPTYLTDLNSIRCTVGKPKLAEMWGMFVEAVVDMIAWEEGWLGERIAGMFTNREATGWEGKRVAEGHTISPLVNGDLLLELDPTCRIPMDRTIQEDVMQGEGLPEKGMFRLWPLRQNGWLMRVGEIPEDLIQQLREDFEAVLGRSWLGGKAREGTGKEEEEGEEIIWGSFWTSLSEAEGNPMVGIKEGSSGAVTIWPMHLLEPPLGVKMVAESPRTSYQEHDGLISGNEVENLLRKTANEDVTSSWLLDQAKSTLTAWREYGNRPIESTPPIITLPLPMESPRAHKVKESAEPNSSEMGESDDDDLFGSSPEPHPSSPDPNTQMDIDNDTTTNAGPIAHDSVEAASSALMSPTLRASDLRYNGDNNSSGPQPDSMVTEDDFDFFDGPTETPVMGSDGMMEGVFQIDDSGAYDDRQYRDGYDTSMDYDGFPPAQDTAEKEYMVEEIKEALPPAYEEEKNLAPAQTAPDAEQAIDHPTKEDSGNTDPLARIGLEEEQTIPTPPRSPSPTLLLVESPPARETMQQQLARCLPTVLPADSLRCLPRLVQDLIPESLWPIALSIPFQSSARFRPTRHSISTWGDGKVRDRVNLRSRLREQEAARLKQQNIANKQSLVFWRNSILMEGRLPLHQGVSPETFGAEGSPAKSTWDEEDDDVSSSSGSSVHYSDALHNVISVGVNLFGSQVTSEMAFQCGIHLTSGQAKHLEEVHPEGAESYQVVSIIKADGQEANLDDMVPWIDHRRQSDHLTAEISRSMSSMNHGTSALAFSTIWPSIDPLFSPTPLPIPEIYAGHDGNVLRLSASSIPYWPQLQLEPWAGKRNVVLQWMYDSRRCCDNSDLREMERWQRDYVLAYEERNLGKMEVMNVVADKDSIARSIDTFHKTERRNPLVLVFYHCDGLYSQDRYLEACTRGTLIHQIPFSKRRQPSEVAFSSFAIYDSLSRSPSISARTSAGPAYLLAERDLFSKPIFTRAWPPPALDLLKNRRFLHVSYQLMEDGKLSIVCADGQGECVERTRETVKKGEGWEGFVKRVWEFAMDFMRRGRIEWRVNVLLTERSKVEELEAWHALLAKKLSSTSKGILATVSLLRHERPERLALSSTSDESTFIPFPVRRIISLPSDDGFGRIISPEVSAYYTLPKHSSSSTSSSTLLSLHVLLIGRTTTFTISYTRQGHLKELVQNIRDLNALRRYQL